MLAGKRVTKNSHRQRSAKPFANRRWRRFEALESRQLLAGNVDVFSPFGSLTLFGDNDDNAVEVRTNADGDVVVVGIKGTTVNGSSDPFVAASGDTIARNMRVFLGSGDDSILIEGVTIGRDLYVYGNGGDDAVGLLRSTVGDDAVVFGGGGELHFSLDLSTVNDDLRVYGGWRDDVIAFDESTVGGNTFVTTAGGDDTVVVRGSDHQDRVQINTGSGDDLVAVIETQIADDVFALLGRGDDALLIEDSSLGDRVIASGGPGNDSLELAGEVSLNASRTRTYRFEQSEVIDADERVEQAIADLVASHARRPTLLDLATGSDDFTILVGLLSQAGLVGALQGSDPLTVFAPTNEAFADFISEFNLTVNPDGTLDVPTELLTSVLTFHVAEGSLDAERVVRLSSVPTLLAGESISVQFVGGQVELDGRAGLLVVDLRARDGIIHVIDTVLTPTALDS